MKIKIELNNYYKIYHLMVLMCDKMRLKYELKSDKLNNRNKKSRTTE